MMYRRAVPITLRTYHYVLCVCDGTCIRNSKQVSHHRSKDGRCTMKHLQENIKCLSASIDLAISEHMSLTHGDHRDSDCHACGCYMRQALGLFRPNNLDRQINSFAPRVLRCWSLQVLACSGLAWENAGFKSILSARAKRSHVIRGSKRLMEAECRRDGAIRWYQSHEIKNMHEAWALYDVWVR